MFLDRGVKLNQCGVFFSEATSAAGTLSIVILCFNTGTEAQDRGEDRQKETLSVRA